MDTRTGQLLRALDATAAATLLEMLKRPATEAELRLIAEEPSQSTMNRRLTRMREAGLIHREPGKAKAPGRLWTVVHPDETADLLDSLLSLAGAVEARDKKRREQARRELKRARASRAGLRVLGQGGGHR